MHEAKPMPNGLRYESGQKRCTFCGLFFLIDDVLAVKSFWEQTQEADIRIRKDKKLSQNGSCLIGFELQWIL